MDTKYSERRINFIKSLEVSELKNNENEIEANEKFLKLIRETRKEIDEGFHFDALSYFEHAKKTKLYQLLTQIPKGGLQHHHSVMHADAEYLYKLLINEDKAYVDMTLQKLIFSASDPGGNFVKIKGSKNFKEDELKELFRFDKDESVPIWRRFDKVFLNVDLFISNTKYFKDYLRDLFNHCLDEEILIYQSRHFFGYIVDYESSDNEIKYIHVVQEVEMILEVIEEVRKREPYFETNFILQGLRNFSAEQIVKELEKFVYLKNYKKEFDDLIIGFDLVGDETMQESKCFAEVLHEFREKVERENLLPKSKLEYYLHAGEFISEHNDNMIDAVLLKCPRIGHGTNLMKNLHLLEYFKKEKVCFECNPLSNQVLKYIHDLRNHPMKSFYNYGVKVTVNSDDDGTFGTSSLITFDTFICAFSMNFNLMELKNVYENSIEYSGIEVGRKEKIKSEWEKRWNSFIIFLLNNY
jgi:adenosine deaminase CECR1